MPCLIIQISLRRTVMHCLVPLAVTSGNGMGAMPPAPLENPEVIALHVVPHLWHSVTCSSGSTLVTLLWTGDLPL